MPGLRVEPSELRAMNKENKYIQSLRTLMDEGLEAKAVKYHAGHDGCAGVNANIYHKNKKVAEVHDDAWGGCLEIRYTARGPHRHDREGPTYRSEISRIKDSLEPYPWNIEGFTSERLCEWDEDHIYNKLIEIHDSKKELKKLLKHRILYRERHDDLNLGDIRMQTFKSRATGKRVVITHEHIERFLQEHSEAPESKDILNLWDFDKALLFWIEWTSSEESSGTAR